MPTLQISVVQTAKFSVPEITQQQLRRFGGAAIERILDRVGRFQNALDQPAKPYSAHGPVYIPVSGVGKILKAPTRYSGGSALLRKNLSPEKLKLFLEPRTKASLGGREVFTKQDLRKLRASGVIAKAGKSSPTALGAVTPSGKSVKFANYKAYKQALGKSGNRDLQLSNRMLGAMTIVQVTRNTVVIGWARDEERLIAEGNQARDPWFGLSPSDRLFLAELAVRL